MVDGTLTLAPFYAGWVRYQGLLSDSISQLTGEHLARTAAPHLRPAWVLAAHIIAARAYWFHHVLGEGDPAIAPLRTWDDDGMPQRTAAELIDGLTQTWALIRDGLDRWPPMMLADEFTTPRGAVVTRQWVIWHVIEHDLHHGGELFFTLGVHGRPTPDL
ncbi:MAG: DinB family protein [Thermomicrobiales bacterium]